MATTEHTISYIKSFFVLLTASCDVKRVESHLSYVEGMISLASVCTGIIDFKQAKELRLEAEAIADTRIKELI